MAVKKDKKPLEDEAMLTAWQQKLLPFMIIVPLALAVVFIVLATVQMQKFNSVMDSKADSTLIDKVLPMAATSPTQKIADNESMKWSTLAVLEQQSLDKRYKQGGLLLASRIYTKYLGFFTGMLMAIVGSVFIIGKLSTGQSTVGATVKEIIKFNVVSTSPGIIFGGLGTLLMALSIMQHNDITVQDSSLYLNAQTIAAMNLKQSAAATPSQQIPVGDVNKVWPDTANRKQPSTKIKKKPGKKNHRKH